MGLGVDNHYCANCNKKVSIVYPGGAVKDLKDCYRCADCGQEFCESCSSGFFSTCCPSCDSKNVDKVRYHQHHCDSY